MEQLDFETGGNVWPNVTQPRAMLTVGGPAGVIATIQNCFLELAENGQSVGKLYSEYGVFRFEGDIEASVRAFRKMLEEVTA